MKLLIDYADINIIKDVYDYFPLDGVTTNPSILKAAGKNPIEQLKAIKNIINGGELHAQVISQTAEAMLEEAKFMRNALGEDIFIKVPATIEGIKGMKLIHAEGMKITATVIYSAMQAYLAGKAGADYTAPYVNRLDNMGIDGIQLTKDIHDIFTKNQMKTSVIGASFKNTQQILALCRYGIGAVTAPPDVLGNLIAHDATEKAVKVFTNDFHTLLGKDSTMMNA